MGIAMQETNAQQSEEQESETHGELDFDYLLALSVEQEDIIKNAVDMFDSSKSTDSNAQNVLISDAEIVALLEQPGIDCDALLNTYPSLTRQYVLDLIRKQKTRKNENKFHKKWKKKKNKQRKKQQKQLDDEMEQVDADTNTKEEVDDNLDAFMQKFKTFNKKSDFINKQKQRNDVEQTAENGLKKKKRRRRRKDKNSPQNVQRSNKQSPANKSSPPSSTSSCNACNKECGSKNKLFDHLKQF